MRKAIYPGSFDPPTLGHVDIINRCLPFVDELYIGIGANSLKSHPTFSAQERVDLLNRIFKTNSTPLVVQNLGTSQNQRLRVDPIEAASYPRDRSDADRVKDQDGDTGKNQVLNHERYKIKVVTFSGLLVDFVKKHSIDMIIRSFRTSADINFEMAQASLNRQMTGIETFWINALPQYRDLSSTLIKEIGQSGKSLDHFIPSEILKEVEDRLTIEGAHR